VDYRPSEHRAERFYAAVRRYWPALPDGALRPGYAGIRPKLVGPGEAAADFQVLRAEDHGVGGLVVLLGIESPGLTAALALAEEVVDPSRRGGALRATGPTREGGERPHEPFPGGTPSGGVGAAEGASCYLFPWPACPHGAGAR